MNLEELKKEFLKRYYNCGDLNAFEFLDKETSCNKNIDIEIIKELCEIVPILIKLNYLELEFENGAYNEKVYNTLSKYNISDFYMEIKGILIFDILKFTEETFIEILDNGV